ncbi:hypothetical protein LINPERHAP1_LOCUS13317 [Linum perenne]
MRVEVGGEGRRREAVLEVGRRDPDNGGGAMADLGGSVCGERHFGNAIDFPTLDCTRGSYAGYGIVCRK